MSFTFYPTFDYHILGVRARKQMAHKTIYRIRSGRQQQYAYFIPGDPRNPVVLYNRWKFKQAVFAWHDLTDQGKEFWDTRVPGHKIMSGFNFFISEYIRTFLPS